MQGSTLEPMLLEFRRLYTVDISAESFSDQIWRLELKVVHIMDSSTMLIYLQAHGCLAFPVRV